MNREFNKKISSRKQGLRTVVMVMAVAIGIATGIPFFAQTVADLYIYGPLPDGSGDRDAVLEMDPKFTPWAPPFLLKQLPVTIAGTVQGHMHKRPYPELIGWFSTNAENEMDLRGTVTVYMGEEMEQHTFNAPTLIYIPANVPHGVVVYGKDIAKPIMFVDTFPEGKKGAVQELTSLERKLPDLKKGLPDKSTNPAGGGSWNPAGGGIYGK